MIPGGRHLGEGLGQGLVALTGDVLVDLERVDDARVAEHDLHLAVEERDVTHLGLGLLGAGGVAHETLDDAALEQMLLDDLGGVVGTEVLVEDAVGIDGGHRADHAGAQAAGFDDFDLVLQAVLLELLAQSRGNFKGS